MYAVIETGSKQYRVKENDLISIEKVDHAPGESFFFPDVLLYVNDTKTLVGTPTLTDVKVEGCLVSHQKDKKVTIVKFKKVKKYRRKTGHRQEKSIVKILHIQASA